MERKTLMELKEQGHNLIEEKNFFKAEQVLKTALEIEEDITVRNNLALAIFMAGEASRALAVLKPNLKHLINSIGNPFSFGLAARICAALGREKEARDYLKSAIYFFERGRTLFQGEQSWNEYTIIIMRGAAALNDHHLVFDLYLRWERYHVSWENRYMAGVAAFNMGRYGRAASLWGSLSGTGRFAVSMQQVAFLVERGLVPPFTLEYKPFDPTPLKQLNPEAPKEEQEKILSSYLHSTAARAAALAYLFSPGIDKKSIESILRSLIEYGGEWGESFGKRLLEAAAVPREFKFCALLALVKCGVFAMDEPVPVLIDGEEKKIKISKVEIDLESDSELQELNRQAKELRDRGCPEEAVKLLEPLYKEGRFYPVAMVTLANLYRTLKRFKEAREILELLDDLLPESPVVLFNLAGLWVECGDFQRALKLLDQLEGLELSKEIGDKVKDLRTFINKEMDRQEPEDL